MTTQFRTIAAAALLCLAACSERRAPTDVATEKVDTGASAEALRKRPPVPGAGQPGEIPCTLRAGSEGNTCPKPAVCVPVACTNSIPPSCTGTCRLPLGWAGAPAPAPLELCTSDASCTADQYCSVNDGVCNPTPCAPGRLCPQVCTGFCVPRRPTDIP